VQFDQPGTYDVQLTAFNLNGPGSVTKLDYIRLGGYGLPFEESFTEGFQGKHWEVLNPDGMITWDTIEVAGTLQGTKAAWVNFFNYTAINRRDQLVSPAMDFTGYGIVTLSFRHAYAQRASLKDSLIVKISDDCGATWTRIWGTGPDGTPNAFVTAPATMESFFPQSADQWCGGSYGVGCYNVDLSSAANKNNVKIMFESYNRNGNNLFLNNISVTGIVGMEEGGIRGRNITVYPNPTTGLLNLVYHQNLKALNFKVFSLQGQVVRTGSLPEASKGETGRIDLSGLPKGIYTLRMTTETLTQVDKIVIE
jgi:PKD repeat protein